MIVRERSLIRVMSFRAAEKLGLNFKIVLLIEFLQIKLLIIKFLGL
jgi:hypothetical protein